MPPANSILLDPCTAFSCRDRPELPGGYKLDRAVRESDRIVLHISQGETLQFVLHVVPRCEAQPDAVTTQDIAFDTRECPAQVPADDIGTLLGELSARYKDRHERQPEQGLYTATIAPGNDWPAWSLTHEVLPFFLLVLLVTLALSSVWKSRKMPFFQAVKGASISLAQILAIIALCLLCGEAALRAIDYDPSHRSDLYRKNGLYHFSERTEKTQEQDLHRNLVTESVDGIDFWMLKDPERDAKGYQEYKVADRPGIRLLGVGDSIMFGSGVRNHQTFLSVIQDLGRKEGIPLESLNVAMPGWNLPQYRIACSRYIKATNPDIVLIGLHHGDVTPVKLSGKRTVNADALVAGPAVLADGLPLEKEDARLLGRHSVLARAMAYWISRGRVPRRYRLVGKRELLTRELDQIEQLCRKNGAKLAIAWMPPMHRPFGEQIDHPAWMEDVWSQVQTWSKTHPDVLLIDPRENLRGIAPEAVRLDLCCHLNSKGHVRMGRALLDALVRAGWLQKQEKSDTKK